FTCDKHRPADPARTAPGRAGLVTKTGTGSFTGAGPLFSPPGATGKVLCCSVFRRMRESMCLECATHGREASYPLGKAQYDVAPNSPKPALDLVRAREFDRIPSLGSLCPLTQRRLGTYGFE